VNFGKVANGVVHETIDWGVAHLYCHSLGWKFDAPADMTVSSGANMFLAEEKKRLKLKFFELTSLDFDEQTTNDINQQQSRRRSEDARSQVSSKPMLTIT